MCILKSHRTTQCNSYQIQLSLFKVFFLALPLYRFLTIMSKLFSQIVKDGQRHIKVMRFDHPHRHQRVIVVPTPRYASREFYDDWVYQPYIKDNELVIADDIFAPLHVAAGRLLLSRTPGIVYFHPGNMPGPLDTNLTRREFYRRDGIMRSPFLRLIFFTVHFRDLNHPWVRKSVRQLVGEKYLVHPNETKTFVLLVNPHWADTAKTALEELGFAVGEVNEVPAGNDEHVRLLETAGDWFNFFLCGYLWTLIIICTTAQGKSFAEYGRKVKEEEIAKGKY
eukprot:PhM_4_TR6208/c0_g1_i1/m.89209